MFFESMKLFVLTADTDGGPFRQLIQIKVNRIVEAAQLARLAKPGETISENLIRPHKVTLKSDQATVPLSYAEAIGKSLRRFKSAGTILRSSDLSAEADCKNNFTGSHCCLDPGRASRTCSHDGQT